MVIILYIKSPLNPPVIVLAIINRLNGFCGLLTSPIISFLKYNIVASAVPKCRNSASCIAVIGGLLNMLVEIIVINPSLDIGIHSVIPCIIPVIISCITLLI